MDWKIVLLVFGAIFLNTFLVLLVLFLFFKNKELGSKKKLVDKNIFYRRLNLVFFIVLLLVGNWLFFYFIQKKQNSYEIGKINLEGVNENTQEDEKTKAIRTPKTVHPNGLNFIFYADKYPNQEEFDSDIDFLMKGLGTVLPWNNYSEYNVYKIFPEGENEICTIKTENERKPALRCNSDINSYLNKLSLEKFKLIVLSRQEFQSWANVARLDNSGIFFSLKDKISEDDSKLQNVLFFHLMGHAFGLKDEEKYVLAKDGGAPHTPDGPNCAPDEETAQEWWGDLEKNDQVGYFETCCGNDDYIKPTKTSLMNLNSEVPQFTPTYGPVSERYLKKILAYCFSEEKIKYEDDRNFFDRYQEFKKCL